MVAALFFGMIALILLGMDIAFAMGFAALGYILVHNLVTRPLPLTIIPLQLFDGIDSFVLCAIPLFILTGEIMTRGGITRRLVDFARAFIGSSRGGLGHVTVVVNMIMAGMSGSAVADTAATGSLLIPAMEQDDYKPSFAAAIVASASTIGPIIPPSIPLILIGAITGTSVGRLFIGGAIPGFLMGIALMIYISYYAKRHRFKQGDRVSWAERLKACRKALLPMGLPVIILGGILGGITTPTEAGVVGVLYAMILVVFVYREIKITGLYKIFIDAAITSAMVMFLVSTGVLFGWVATAEQLGPHMTKFIYYLTTNKYAILLIINIMLLVMGMVLEALPIILLMTPILFPIAESLGIDTVHFGVLMCLNLMIGLLTPPIGLNLFITSAIAKVSVGSVMRDSFPFVIVLLIVLAIVTYFPPAVTWLPELIFG